MATSPSPTLEVWEVKAVQLPQVTGPIMSMHTLVLHHSVMHSQQKRWPQGVAVECLRSSKHRVQSGVLHTALSSMELLWG